MNPDSRHVQFELQVSPLQFRLADVATTKIELHVLNQGTQNVDTENYRYELLIDGESSMIWSMAIGNRMYDNKWLSLPPQDSVSEDFSSLAPRLFTHAGRYHLQLKWKELKGKTIIVEVTE